MKCQYAIFLLLLISCREASRQASGKEDVIPTITTSPKKPVTISDSLYADINIFQMKGISLLSKKSLPAFAIKDSGNYKVITSYIDSFTVMSNSFFRQGKYWASQYQIPADTSGAHYHCTEIIDTGRILVFTYDDTTSKSLIDLEIIDGALVSHYSFGQGIYFPLDVLKVNNILSKARLNGFTRYQTHGDVLNVYTENADSTGRVYYKEEECYKSNNRSTFWWRNFGIFQKRVNCSVGR